MYKSLFLICLLFLLPVLSFGQFKTSDTQEGEEITTNRFAPKSGSTPGFTPPPPDPIPIDGGLSFLMLAGVGYGISRFKKKC